METGRHAYGCDREFLDENGRQRKAGSCGIQGGHTRPLTGGTYLINQVMLEESASEVYGNHACDLALSLASRLARYGARPMTANTPVTDEFEPWQDIRVYQK